MNRTKLSTAALAALLAAGAAACSDAASPAALVTDNEVTADLVAASGEAIANDVTELILNEAFAGLPAAAPPSFSLFGSPPGVTVTRTRTCYDAANVQQAQCDPNTTASIRMTMTMDGSFTRSHTGPRGSETMTAAVHRARTLVVSGLAGQETSRTHNGNGTSNDTTEFSGTRDGVTLTREVRESSNDSILNIVFNLPRSTNPWPVSGSIVRNSAGTIEISVTGGTAGDRSETRTFQRRVVVTFPADAQGNVTIQINDRTCTLNLVTRAVTNCST